jgi:hypothetical protein
VRVSTKGKEFIDDVSIRWKLVAERIKFNRIEPCDKALRIRAVECWRFDVKPDRRIFSILLLLGRNIIWP